MELRARLLRRVDSLAREIVEVSRYVHGHPEAGFAEFESSRHLVEKLASHGFRVERRAAGLATAWRASARGRSPGPAIGFIAEYDALPGMGHGCGHNLISAAAFGAAAALAPLLARAPGSVWVFGTPAEEAGSAKVPMLRAGVFDPADAILMMHPESMYVVNTRGLALDALEFRFLGRATHAAATPHEGLNALDAVIQLFNSVNALRQQLPPGARVHGIITRGGDYPNIIPGLAEARFYVRADTRPQLDPVTRRVKACARGAAQAAGCRLRTRAFEHSLDEIVNNPVLAGLVEGHLRALGVRRIEPRDPAPGSTDFGNVSRRVPCLYFYGATAPRGLDLHTPEFAKASVSEQAHRSLLLCVKAMALSALDVLRRPALLRRIRAAA